MPCGLPGARFGRRGSTLSVLIQPRLVMSLGRTFFDHAIRYRRFGSFAALGARRDAAGRTYRAHALHEMLRRPDAAGPGWADAAGFRMRYLESRAR